LLTSVHKPLGAAWAQVLKNQDGEAVTLSSFKGKAPVVIFFYPKAASPGCTAEACAFRDAFERFKKAGVKVCGRSSGTASPCAHA
jgi:thioredoxin-dependent peroxiredoxin